MSESGNLALLGGEKSVQQAPKDMFHWPIITEEDEAAALEVLRNGAMSGLDVTKKFEQEIAEWMKIPYALGFHNGTAALQAAMYGCHIGLGDEIICPSITYWASALPAYSLGATPVFAEIDPATLCLDPNDIEHRITERTKAIVVVHYCGHPAEMDAIMDIANKHNIKVIEDVSHAQGGLYKGKMLGTIGHVGAYSLMSGKAFAIGEAGMMVTSDREIYERAIAFGHYARYNDEIETEDLRPYRGLPLGGYKYRMHQISSAVGRVQLKYYDQRIEEIDRAMNYFWDSLEGVPGIRPHRPDPELGHFNGGWYAARGFYVTEELNGLSVTRFCEALQAEGVPTSPGCNMPLHLHPVFNDADIYGHGKPTRIAHSDQDVRQPAGSLPISEKIGQQLYTIPWFKKDQKDIIDQYVNAFKKVSEQHEKLLEGDEGNPETLGMWGLTQRK